MGGRHPRLRGPEQNKRSEEGRICSLSWSWDPQSSLLPPLSVSTPACSAAFQTQSRVHTLGFAHLRAFRPRLNPIPPFPFLGLQPAEGRRWGFRATPVTGAPSYNQSPLTDPSTSYWFCFFGEPRAKQLWQQLPHCGAWVSTRVCVVGVMLSASLCGDGEFLPTRDAG